MDDRWATLLTDTIADGVYPLPGYARRQFTGGDVVAAASVRDALFAIIATHGTWYAWASTQPQTRALRGRAPVYIAHLADALDTSVVIRHVWHGGLLAPLTRDRFRRPTRAPLELLRAVMLRARGVPTPEVMGFALYDAGPGFVRIDVATRYIPDSHDFAAVLANVAPDITRSAAFDAIALLLHQLSRNGFTHPDLNVKNILLQQTGPTLQASVLDVDVMRWDAHLPVAVAMRQNTDRLLRSLAKARRQFGITFTDAERDTFVRGVSRDVSDTLRDSSRTPPPAASGRR